MLRHPVRVVQQHAASVSVHLIEFRSLGFDVEVLTDRLQKHRVVPVPFRIQQLERGNIILGMNDAKDQLFGFIEEGLIQRGPEADQQGRHGIRRTAAGTVIERVAGGVAKPVGPRSSRRNTVFDPSSICITHRARAMAASCVSRLRRSGSGAATNRARSNAQPMARRRKRRLP